jgi:hypothetical protein
MISYPDKAVYIVILVIFYKSTQDKPCPVILRAASAASDTDDAQPDIVKLPHHINVATSPESPV